MSNLPLREDEQILVEVRRELEQAWLEQMPSYFFRLTSETEKVIWLNSLLIYRYTGAAVALRKDNMLYQVGEVAPQNLIRNLEKIQDEDILGGAIYRSQKPIWEGGEIVEFLRFELWQPEEGEPQHGVTDEELKDVAWDVVQETLGNLTGSWHDEETLRSWLKGFARGFVQNSSPERLAGFLALYLRCREEDSLLVRSQIFWKSDRSGEGFNRILIGTVNPPPTGFILRLARIFERANLRLNRIIVSTAVPPGEEQTQENWIGLSGFYITDHEQKPLLPGDPRYERLMVELSNARLSVLGNAREGGEMPWPLTAAGSWEQNVQRVCAEFLELAFGAVRPLNFNRDSILHAFIQYPVLAEALTLYFHTRCHPWERRKDSEETSLADLEKQLEELNTGVASEDNAVRTVYRGAIAFIASIRRTNFFRDEKAAYSFSLDPEVIRYFEEGAPLYEEIPQSLIYITAADFSGFHVAFSNHARGGLRTVLPRNVLRHQVARRGLLKECYDLAWTQHFKNKDIPEGGAKGIILTRPGVPQRPCQRSFVREFISLMIAREAPERASDMPELKPGGSTLFLGPDENMTNDMIIWIDDFSAKRGTQAGPALMSGHPSQGINHKQYGVTSQGVFAYLEEGLRHLGIEPAQQTFRVKYSGGPDGDVAGNGIRLLIENYPDTAKIVAITDGTGFGHDPEGLNAGELMRLFREGKGIGEFSPVYLGKQGRLLVLSRESQGAPVLYTCREGKAEQEALDPNAANRLHQRGLHEVEAEAFIPAGGRPNTLDETNWHWFLKEGKPTTPLIVEGANLYFTTRARQEIEAKGVLIFKDSSANKCGVITSSYEEVGLLLMGPARFSKLLPEFIPDLMQLLQERARQEARWLLEHYQKGVAEKSLSILSADYSNQVRARRAEIAEQVREDFHKLEQELARQKVSDKQIEDPEQKRLFDAFKAYIPARFLQEVSPFEAWDRLSSDHRLAIIALQLANPLPQH